MTGAGGNLAHFEALNSIEHARVERYLGGLLTALHGLNAQLTSRVVSKCEEITRMRQNQCMVFAARGTLDGNVKIHLSRRGDEHRRSDVSCEVATKLGISVQAPAEQGKLRLQLTLLTSTLRSR